MRSHLKFSDFPRKLSSFFGLCRRTHPYCQDGGASPPVATIMPPGSLTKTHRICPGGNKPQATSYTLRIERKRRPIRYMGSRWKRHLKTRWYHTTFGVGKRNNGGHPVWRQVVQQSRDHEGACPRQGCHFQWSDYRIDLCFFTHLPDKRAFKGSTISKYLVQKRAARALHFQNTLEQWRPSAAAAVVIPVYPHLLLFFAFF